MADTGARIRSRSPLRSISRNSNSLINRKMPRVPRKAVPSSVPTTSRPTSRVSFERPRGDAHGFALERQTVSAQEALRAGRLDEALTQLKQDVRRQPADARLRIFLFQLLCVSGEWDRALTQLSVAG